MYFKNQKITEKKDLKQVNLDNKIKLLENSLQKKEQLLVNVKLNYLPEISQ